jgi:iron complex outermembrane receptor protein
MPTVPRLFALRPLAALMLCYSVFAHAADPAASDVFQLGEIDIKSASDQPQGFKGETINEQAMQSFQALDVGQALANTTGVSPTMTGQRNESQVYIRGFNQNQITLNVDGIPIYVPYDGNVDLSRLLVPNLSEIVVTKGLGSLMYGPNNMGGTINLITKRPDQPLTVDASAGITANQKQVYGGNGSVQVGSRLNERWYVTGGIAYSGMSGYPLSDSFSAVAVQPSGNRLHAGSNIDNFNVKAGFTPNATDEYSLGISTVNSTKQSEPYTGSAAGQKVAYWDWPQWDKQSYYFIGNTALGAGYLKTRVYYDRFVNRLSAYDNASYTTTTKPFAFFSKYDDHSSGLNLEWDQPIGAEHLLKVAAFYKQDVHTEIALADGHQAYDSPWLHFTANTVSAGVEDTWHADKATEVTAGLRHDRHEFTQAEVYTSAADTAVVPQTIAPAADANNWQITVQRDLGEGEPVVRAGIARKTRFPGIKDVYSFKLGNAIPNPALGSEQALNREIGVSGRINQASYDVALYWDSIDNAITSVALLPITICSPQPTSCTQNQNTGTATNKGLDASLKMPLAANWLGLINYSYLDSTLGQSGLVATGTSKTRAGATVTWLASEAVEASADVQGNSGIQTATNGLQPVSGNIVANLRMTGHISKALTFNGGIYNLFDRNYELVEGFPMPGRLMKLGLNYHM